LVTGLAVNVITIPVVTSLGGGQQAWTITTLVYGGLALITLLVVFFGTKERVRPARTEDNTERRPVRQLVALLFRYPYFLLCFGFSLFLFLRSVTSSVCMYYAFDVLGDLNVYSLLSLACLARILINIWFIPLVIARFGKLKP